MLKFENYSIFSLHVRDMLFSNFGPMNYLLPVFGKLAFPSAMPFCFLPPRVAGETSTVRPMPFSNIPTFCDYGITANWACGRQASLRRASLFSDERKLQFHLISP
jgi:hypothetical protein